MRKTILLLFVFLLSTSSAWATDVPEIEPNDTKATAQPVTLNCGDVLTGSSTGSADTPTGDITTADYFALGSGNVSGGLRRYRLGFPASAHDISLRGRNPVITPSDLNFQPAFTAQDGSRYVAWYGLGISGDRFMTRIAGDATTTLPYGGTLKCTPVTPALFPQILPSGATEIRLTVGRLAVFNAAGGTQPSWHGQPYITVSFSAGEYWVAATRGTLCTAASNAPRADYAGVAATDYNGGVTSNTLQIKFGPGYSTTDSIPLLSPERGDIAWTRFFVAGSGPGACCLLAGCTPNMTTADCTAQGGIFLGGGVPCVTELCPRACCFVGGECQFVAQGRCTQIGGAWQAAGTSCASNPCPAVYGGGCANPVLVSIPLQLPFSDTRSTCGLGRTVACAGTDEDAVYQLTVSELTCLRISVQSSAAAPTFSMATFCPPCPGTTYVTRDPLLLSPGTHWLSVQSNPCAEYTLTIDECAPRGCCFSDGSCQLLEPLACAQAAGAAAAAGSDCSPGVCPPAVTCCFGNGGCQRLTAAACVNTGGRIVDDQSSCEPNFCIEIRACCLADGNCLDGITVAACLERFGYVQTVGVTCPAGCAAVCLRGDINCDGVVNNFDIDPFVIAVVHGGFASMPSNWPSTPACWAIVSCTADLDHSGNSMFNPNNFDIDPFIVCITSTPFPRDPCP